MIERDYRDKKFLSDNFKKQLTQPTWEVIERFFETKESAERHAKEWERKGHETVVIRFSGEESWWVYVNIHKK